MSRMLWCFNKGILQYYLKFQVSLKIRLSFHSRLTTLYVDVGFIHLHHPQLTRVFKLLLCPKGIDEKVK